MLKLYEHQEKSINEIFKVFETENRCLYQLATGGGKTVVFTSLAKRFCENNTTKILVLCHRSELVQQTIDTFVRFGLTCESITSKVKRAKHFSDVYVGMEKTVHNRLKTDPNFFKEIGLIIADECHLDVFDKVFNKFPNAKILGCTATPTTLKKINFTRCGYCQTEYDTINVCCGVETMEYTKPFNLSEIYHNIVVGKDIADLIEDGKLVQEINYVQPFESSKLTLDHTGEFSNESVNNEFSKESNLFNVLKNYENICKGKKTIIFNANTKLNKLVYDKFFEAGYNVRYFDSENTASDSRIELVEWFKRERDAILCNVSIFTTGFDVTDVEAVILNRPTMSLSLFLQMVGRGGRITSLIYKPNFILIDGGGNVERFGNWSAQRDWVSIFYGTDQKPKPKKQQPEDIRLCNTCGFMYAKTESNCPNCQSEPPIPIPKIKTESETLNVRQNEIPLPNGNSIRMYVESVNGNRDMAWRILINQIFDLFILHQVSKEQYLKNDIPKKVGNLVSKCYYQIAKLEGTNRTKEYLVNKVITKLEKYYGI